MYQGRFSGSGQPLPQEPSDDNFLEDPIFQENIDSPQMENPEENLNSQEYAMPYEDPAGPQDYGEAYSSQSYGEEYTDPGYPPYQEYAGGPYEQQTYGDAGYADPPLEQPRRRIRKGPIIVGILFYLAYFGAIGLFYVHNQKNLQKVETALVSYEQAQPIHVSEQVFQQLFADPDWAALYEQAGIEDSEYEGKEAFVSFMKERVGEAPLSYQQITFDQSQELQYEVFRETDKVAAFTLKNESESVQNPSWQLGRIQLYYRPEGKYRISMEDGQKVSVNGVALDDSTVLQEDYRETVDEAKTRLPGTKILEISGFLVRPTVTAEDAAGKALVVSFSQKDNTFTVPQSPTGGLSEQQKQIALDAIHTYCKFMINEAGGQAGLAKYFKQDTATFKAIAGSDLTWIQQESGHNFANETVSDYVSYGDNKFSVRVELTFQLTRPDSSIKESPVEKTMVFEKFEDKWLCTRMTGLKLTRPVQKVRLTYWAGDEVLDSVLVDAASETVACPPINTLERKEIAGWAVLKTQEDGTQVYQRVLEADAKGSTKVPSGLKLQPMDLYPVFSQE